MIKLRLLLLPSEIPKYLVFADPIHYGRLATMKLAGGCPKRCSSFPLGVLCNLMKPGFANWDEQPDPKHPFPLQTRELGQ